MATPDIGDEDMKRLSIKIFQDGTEIRFKLGSGLENGTRDFYQVAYLVNKKAICLNDPEIFEYCRRLTIYNNIDLLVDTIYKIYRYDIDKMNELSGFNIRTLINNIQSREIKIVNNTDVVANVSTFKEDDNQLIKEMKSCVKKKIDGIVDKSRIKSISCITEKKDVELDQNGIVDKLFEELKFCHEKFFYYLYTVFISEDMYLIGGRYPTKYGRKLKMAGILYTLKENWDPTIAAKQFHKRAGKEIEPKLKIIQKYDKEQKNIEDAWT